jgi:hypothetical protein
MKYIYTCGDVRLIYDNQANYHVDGRHCIIYNRYKVPMSIEEALGAVHKLEVVRILLKLGVL